MKQILSKLKYLYNYIGSYVPQKLPVGVTAFNRFADDIIELSGPYADRDSLRFAIATNIIHLPHNQSSASKQLFVRRLRKAAANQVASIVFQEIKEKQTAATKSIEVVADGAKAQ